MPRRFPLLPLLLLLQPLSAQPFYFGVDLSYVNQLEDCGVTYRENNAPKDVYQIMADRGANLARLRLWHTPSWYDTLNTGQRYSDFTDVRSASLRAQAVGLPVMLDFHFSDTWADPAHQIVPAAWLNVVDNLPVLRDSLYQYVRSTLLALHGEGLLPAIVQLGNETNRGILLAPDVNAAGWTLNWSRNAPLFLSAIQAVRDVEALTGDTIRIALHIAGPANAGWLLDGFWANGVTDFDIIGLSYYWQYHQPTTIAQTGQIIGQLKQEYPGKDVMILETAYPWTQAFDDPAANILNTTHPAYAPASPATQRQWMIDLTEAVLTADGSGVVYWEPAWVSSGCSTAWGQGSHWENATFFDFNDNLLADGGVSWMTAPYDSLSAAVEPARLALKTWVAGDQLFVQRPAGWPAQAAGRLRLFAADGRLVASRVWMEERTGLTIPGAGIYTVVLDLWGRPSAVGRVFAP